MAQTPEGKVKASVKRILDPLKPDLYDYWPVPGGYGKATLDCLGYFRGRGFAIETKAPGKKPTQRQENTLRELRAAGVAVFVIEDLETASDLILWLATVQKA